MWNIIPRDAPIMKSWDDTDPDVQDDILANGSQLIPTVLVIYFAFIPFKQRHVLYETS